MTKVIYVLVTTSTFYAKAKYRWNCAKRAYIVTLYEFMLYKFTSTRKLLTQWWIQLQYPIKFIKFSDETSQFTGELNVNNCGWDKKHKEIIIYNNYFVREIHLLSNKKFHNLCIYIKISSSARFENTIWKFSLKR